MHAMGEINSKNRYDTQPELNGGGFRVIDRVNGMQVGMSLPNAKAAQLEAERLNGAVPA